MENKFANRGIEGINIYRDKKGQTIYLDPFTKKGYVITSTKEKSFKFLSNRYMFTLAVGILCYLLFELGTLISIVITVGVGILLEYLFRKLIRNCTMLDNFKPEKKSKLFNYEQSTKLIVVKTVLYVLLAALLLITTLINKEADTSINAISITAVFICLFIAGKYVSILISRKR